MPLKIQEKIFKEGIMNFRLKINKKQEKELEEKLKLGRQLGELKLVMRISVILLIIQEVSYKQIGQAMQVSLKSIERWVGRYILEGVKGLKSKKGTGRPTKLSKSQKQELIEDIAKSPEKLGYETGVWTAGLVQEHIYKKYKVSYSESYISQLLRNLGFSYTKPKFVYKQEPEDVKKQLEWVRKEFVEIVDKAKQKKSIVIFIDESTFQLQSNSARSWSIKGKSVVFDKNPARGHIKVFGSIELFTGRLIYSTEKDKLSAKRFVKFLKHIVRRYNSQQNIDIILDNATYHKGEVLDDLLKYNPNITLHNLPRRSPHLNPIEKLWKKIKYHKTHNRFFSNLDSLELAIRTGLADFQESRSKVRSLMNKWHKIASNPLAASIGKFDSSFIKKDLIVEAISLFPELAVAA